MSDEEAACAVAVEPGPVTRITLNRPERRNAITFAMQARLTATIAECAARKDVKVLLVRGTGSVFCAGGDIFEYASVRKRTALPQDARFIEVVAAFPKPIVVAVQGYAGPAVLESLIAHADLLVATAGTRFCFEILNVYPTIGAMAIAWKLGPNIANELGLLANELTAERLYEIGVVNRVVPELDQANQLAEQWAARMSGMPLERLMAQKAAFRATFGKIALAVEEWAPFAQAAASGEGESVHAQFEALAGTRGLKAARRFQDDVVKGKA